MFIIDKVTVENFWGEKFLQFDFHDDVNFIIGINGSGKTTAIRLIVAALNADFISLDRLEFSKITINLKSNNSRKKPSVTISKKPEGESLFSSIVYEVREAANAKPKVFALEDYEEKALLRNYQKGSIHRKPNRTREVGIATLIEDLVKNSWLSVQRASHNPRRISASDDKIESLVDLKLDNLLNRLVRYFSALDARDKLLFTGFQKTVFLSMLHQTSDNNWITAGEKNVAEERIELERIFSQFGVDSLEYDERLNTHFNALITAKENLVHETKSLSILDVSVLIANKRVDFIVDEWKSFLSDRAHVFEPRDTFLEIINSMMQRKTFVMTERNELSVKTKSNKDLSLFNLSSGEKQLLIVLSEAVLQEKSSWVYIADEPELSLHVRWQESLVGNLRKINPNAQIIFATHSPDVVSHFGKNVFDMEKLL